MGTLWLPLKNLDLSYVKVLREAQRPAELVVYMELIEWNYDFGTSLKRFSVVEPPNYMFLGGFEAF